MTNASGQKPKSKKLHQAKSPSSPPNAPAGDPFYNTLVNNVHPPVWHNPKPTGKYNLVVIGAGPGGMTAAIEAAALGAKVALIERNLIGGDRLNVGCVPSKAIIRTARLYAEMRDAENFGGQVPRNIDIGFPKVMERMRRTQAHLSRASSAQRLKEAGVDVYFGEAHFAGRDTISVAGDLLDFKKVLIATGARSLTPPIPGIAEAGYLTNENVFTLTKCPGRLLVIGGGPLGCELAQAFCRFGSHVIIAQDDPMFLPKEERDAAQILSDALARDGVEIHLNTTVVAVRRKGTKKIVDLVCDDDRFSVTVDEILAGIGRSPNVESLNLEAAGVLYDTEAGIYVDDFLQSSNPLIYAAGDVCLDHKFTHTAEASARLAVQNALFLRRKRLSALTIPWCTYTDPEIAHVGLYVREAREKSIPVRTFTILMHDVDRAVLDGEEEGFVKIHISQNSDQILGATVVASHAGEMINELSLAISSKIGLRALARVIHSYPTQAEAIKMAADAYTRTRIRPTFKSLIRRWLTW
jgi:pyruvate/2-oxoglutarate dehydrogenase complex dihydrolipoamide dehydrogenase (E3) component